MSHLPTADWVWEGKTTVTMVTMRVSLRRRKKTGKEWAVSGTRVLVSPANTWVHLQFYRCVLLSYKRVCEWNTTILSGRQQKLKISPTTWSRNLLHGAYWELKCQWWTWVISEGFSRQSVPTLQRTPVTQPGRQRLSHLVGLAFSPDGTALWRTAAPEVFSGSGIWRI